MSIDRLEKRSLAAPQMPFFTERDGKNLSEKSAVSGSADIYGNQSVRLYGADGNAILLDDFNQIHTVAPVREPGVQAFNAEEAGKVNAVSLYGPVGTSEYRKFSLYMDIDSTGAPTTLQAEVLFWDPLNNKPHVFKQGLFASLFWEDTDTADGIQECFTGALVGQNIGLRLTVVGGAVGAFFTVSASFEFWG